jgi:hypothetical protein
MARRKIGRIVPKVLDWRIIVLLIFGVCYAFSLTFVCVDNDDALSFAYHAMGRLPQLQPPFEPFQKGMDVVLSVLPSDERIIRVAGMSITALAAIVVVVMMLTLAFEFMTPISQGAKRLIAFGILIASPELIYIGLLYTPILVGACFVLSAHLMLRRVFCDRDLNRPQGKRYAKIALSSILMSIGALFRWDLMVYGVFIAADGFFLWKRSSLSETKSKISNAKVLFLWGVLSFAFWVALVISTTDINGLIKEVGLSMRETALEGFSGRMIGSMPMFFSPVFIVLWCAGVVHTLRSDRRLGIFLSLCLPAALLWPFKGAPKELMVFLPMMVICFAFGLREAWFMQIHGRQWLVVRAGIILVAVVPWFVGVQMTFDDSLWRPNLNEQTNNHPSNAGISLSGIRLTAGTVIPTTEGPRPAFGHFYELVCGGWRRLVSEQAGERNNALRYALNNQLPCIVDADHAGFLYASLAGLGMKTADPEYRRVAEQPISRRFSDSQGRNLVLIRFDIDRLPKNPDWMQNVQMQTIADKCVVFGYPEKIKTIYRHAPSSLDVFGPQSAVLDTRKFFLAPDASSNRIN